MKEVYYSFARRSLLDSLYALKKISIIKIIFFYVIFTSTLFSLSFDIKLSKNEKGLIGAHYYLPKIFYISNLAFVTYFGTTSRFGMTSLKSLDSLFKSVIVTEIFKKTTRRLRPRHTDSPNQWFSKEKGNTSFISGHVSSMTAMVTSYILEYQKDYPSVQLLWFFVAHQMVGRVKAQAHWQSDVIAGAIVGFLSAYIDRKSTPLLLYIFKNKTYLGLKYRF